MHYQKPDCPMTEEELKTEFNKHFNFSDPHTLGLDKEFERQFKITPSKALETIMGIPSHHRRAFLKQIVLEWQYDGLLENYEIGIIPFSHSEQPWSSLKI